MQYIIGGKRYNTDTSTQISCARYGYSGDLDAREETLYRSAKGQMWVETIVSITAASYGGRNSGQLVTLEEAIAWAESHGLGDIELAIPAG
jgi:hypothetical protein